MHVAWKEGSMGETALLWEPHWPEHCLRSGRGLVLRHGDPLGLCCRKKDTLSNGSGNSVCAPQGTHVSVLLLMRAVRKMGGFVFIQCKHECVLMT